MRHDGVNISASYKTWCSAPLSEGDCYDDEDELAHRAFLAGAENMRERAEVCSEASSSHAKGEGGGCNCFGDIRDLPLEVENCGGPNEA